jgi:C-terminal processing protease CtpA/Prc
MFLLLNGPKNSTVELTLKDIAGKTHTVTLTRNSLNRDGTLFKHRIFDVSPLVESKRVGSAIAYLRLATFGVEQLVEDFSAELGKLDLDGLKGMILDLRYNMGGDDRNAYPIVSRLVDRPVLGSTWSTREYLPAFASWGQPEKSYQGDTLRIEPSTSRRYAGPLVVLTGPNTMSTSEDFLVPLDYSGRALLIGEVTAGTTGNPVNASLPGGAILRVCSKRDTYPDGSQFVGRGIEPDILVHPSVAGIRANRDEALEKAIEVLDNWDRYKAMTTYKKPQ